MIKQLIKRTSIGISALVVGVLSPLVFVTPQLVSAASNTCVWTGAAEDSKFSTAGNWTSCGGSVPQDGDILSFKVLGGGTAEIQDLTNDLSGVSLGGISWGDSSKPNAQQTTYTFDKLTFASGAVLSGVSAQGASYPNVYVGYRGVKANLVFQGSVSTNTVSPFYIASDDDGAGNINISLSSLTFNGGGLSTISQAGGGSGGSGPQVTLSSSDVHVTAGAEYRASGTETSITVDNGGRVWLSSNKSSVATNFTFKGSAANKAAIVSVSGNMLSGNVVLSGDAYYYIFGTKTLKVTGALSGSGAFKKATGSTGTFVNNAKSNSSGTASGSQEVPAEEKPPVKDDKPDDTLDVLPKTIVSLDGARGFVSVGDGAILKGVGTAKSLYVDGGGTVAPGHSPGKLTVLETLSLAGGSTYQAEILNKNSYDQIKVSDASVTTGTPVTLGDSNGQPILDVQLVKKFKLNKGDTFTVIDNQSKTNVQGTFKDLAEGATFKVGKGGVFKITYKGGNGNDVVLTVVTVPQSPDTGFGVITENPWMSAGVAVLAAGAIAIIARRYQLASAKVKSNK